jgi:hypothetical protein
MLPMSCARRRRIEPRQVWALALAAACLLSVPSAFQGQAVAAETGLKPVIAGLLDRSGMPPPASQRTVSAFVVDVAWADLQPLKGGQIMSGNAIDQAIDAVRALPPDVPMKLRLRVRAGVDAPEWAKHLGGAPVTVVDGKKTGTVGRFWTAKFGQAYRALQQKLADLYDAVPEVAQVEISRCSTFYAEPFLRQWGDPTTQQNLVAAGYTAGADDACQHQEVDAHQVWLHTRSGLSLNPYQRIGATGTVTVDEAFTETMIGYCRTSLGERCVLENHSIRSPLQSGPYASMYQAIQAAGGPISYQTATPDNIGDWQATLTWAADAGASSVELNRAYPTYDPAVLQDAAFRLAANAT